MSRILAIDLGKFKSVTCLLDSDTNQTEFWTMATDRHYLLTVLKPLGEVGLRAADQRTEDPQEESDRGRGP